MENFTIDKGYLKNKIQNILNKTHKNSDKREIKEFNDRLNFACPICGDSSKVSTKKRGNLYFKNLMFKCFDNGCRVSFLKLCEDFNVDVDIDTRLNLYNYIDSNIHFEKASDDFVIKKLNKLIKIDEFIEFYNTHPEYKLTNIKPVEVNGIIYKYLESRCIKDDPNIYEGIYHFTDTWKEPVLIILNKHKNLILGMQLRNIKDDKDKRFYKIYDFSMIYNIMYPNNKIDDIELITYNKLSHFFNILNVNFNEPVTIFEGYLDSIFVKNSIGTIGTNTDLEFLLKDESLQLRFFHDNDKAGFDASIKMIKQDKPVFLWNLLFKDLLKNKSDKYSAQKYFSTIKDLNKFIIEMNDENINFDRYYSKDQFDMIYLDKKTQLINL